MTDQDPDFDSIWIKTEPSPFGAGYMVTLARYWIPREP